jgi:hypothetical protein
MDAEEKEDDQPSEEQQRPAVAGRQADHHQ